MKSKINSLVTTINQSLLSNKENITCDFSFQNVKFIDLLYKEHLIEKYFIKNNRVYMKLKKQDNKFVIKKIIFPSKKGQQMYVNVDELWNSFSTRYGIFVISTSKGLITDIQAKKLNVGGIIICYITIL